MTENEHELLARIDERVGSLQEQVAGINTKLDNDYVRKGDFIPVRNVVYGFAGIILLSVMGAIVALAMGGKR